MVPGVELLRRRARLGVDFMGRTPGEFAQSQFVDMLLSKQALKSIKEGNPVEAVANLLNENFVTAMYTAAREAAWKSDAALRLVGYKSLLKRGFTKEQAAKMVARTYVDYADMPVKTRRLATLVAFTPVYTFETMLGYGKNAADLVGVMRNVSNGKASPADMKLAATSLVSLVFLQGMVESLMRLSGYDRDEEKWWDHVLMGRKFKKRIVTEEGLKKDLHIRVGGPLTVFQREFDRLMKISDVSNPWEVPQAAFKSLSTLQHPIFRNLKNLINLNDRRGRPIWEEHDPEAVKFGKASKVFLADWVPMLGWAMSSDYGMVDDEARDAALGNWAGTATRVLDALYYPYITDTHNKRVANKIRYHVNAYTRAVRKLYENGGQPDQRTLDGLRANFEAEVDKLKATLE